MVNKLVQSGVGQFSINVKSNLKDFYGTLNKSYQTMKELTERKHQLQVDSQQLDRLRDKAQRIAAEMRELRQQKTEIKLGMKGDEVIQRLKKELAGVNAGIDNINKKKLAIQANLSDVKNASEMVKRLDSSLKLLKAQKASLQVELKNADNTKEQLKNLDKRIASLNRQKLKVEADIQPIRTTNVELHKIDSEINRINKKKMSVDTSNISKQIAKISEKIPNLSNRFSTVNEHLVKMGNHLSSNLDRLSSFSNTLSKISFAPLVAGAAGAVAAIHEISQAGKDLFKDLESDINMEKVFRQNQKLLGIDFKKTDELYKELDRYADRTVYSQADMLNTYTTIANSGVKDAEKIVKGLGAIAATSADSKTAMDALSLQFSQALTNGLQRTDFRIMAEQTQGGLAVAFKQAGKDFADFQRRLGVANEKTNPGIRTRLANELKEVILAAADNPEMNKLAEMPKTMGQAFQVIIESVINKTRKAFKPIQNIGIDWFQKFADDINSINNSDLDEFGNKIADLANNKLKKLYEFIKNTDFKKIWSEFNKGFSKGSEGLKNHFSFFKKISDRFLHFSDKKMDIYEMANKIGEIIPKLFEFSIAMKEISVGLGFLAGTKTLFELFSPTGILQGLLGAGLFGVIKAIKKIIDQMGGFDAAVQRVQDSLQNGRLGKILKKVSGTFDEISDSIANLVLKHKDDIADFLVHMIDKFGNFIDKLKNFDFAGFIKGFVGGCKDVVGDAKRIYNFVKPLLSKLGDGDTAEGLGRMIPRLFEFGTALKIMGALPLVGIAKGVGSVVSTLGRLGKLSLSGIGSLLNGSGKIGKHRKTSIFGKLKGSLGEATSDIGKVAGSAGNLGNGMLGAGVALAGLGYAVDQITDCLEKLNHIPKVDSGKIREVAALFVPGGVIAGLLTGIVALSGPIGALGEGLAGGVLWVIGNTTEQMVDSFDKIANMHVDHKKLKENIKGFEEALGILLGISEGKYETKKKGKKSTLKDYVFGIVDYLKGLFGVKIAENITEAGTNLSKVANAWTQSGILSAYTTMMDQMQKISEFKLDTDIKQTILGNMATVKEVIEIIVGSGATNKKELEKDTNVASDNSIKSKSYKSLASIIEYYKNMAEKMQEIARIVFSPEDVTKVIGSVHEVLATITNMAKVKDKTFTEAFAERHGGGQTGAYDDLDTILYKYKKMAERCKGIQNNSFDKEVVIKIIGEIHNVICEIYARSPLYNEGVPDFGDMADKLDDVDTAIYRYKKILKRLQGLQKEGEKFSASDINNVIAEIDKVINKIAHENPFEKHKGSKKAIATAPPLDAMEVMIEAIIDYNKIGKRAKAIGELGDLDLNKIMNNVDVINKAIRSISSVSDETITSDLQGFSDGLANIINILKSNFPPEFRELGKTLAEKMSKGFKRKLDLFSSMNDEFRRIAKTSFGDLANSFAETFNKKFEAKLNLASILKGALKKALDKDYTTDVKITVKKIRKKAKELPPGVAGPPEIVRASGGAVTSPDGAILKDSPERPFLQNGEYVVPKRIVDKLGIPFFDKLKSGAMTPTFARLAQNVSNTTSSVVNNIYHNNNTQNMNVYTTGNQDLVLAANRRLRIR